ncbi:hypothetical protein QYM36_007693 [Artemia franciscana]|uniref:Sialin n=1 Tax=Artemia franciscana TaxID=6661 RepID=A0AA88LLT1_ARTSF|nr:hypothetical protein QYM36_007693 [Artemia franciscana]
MSCVKARVLFTVLASVGLAILYGLKVNLSVAIVAMVNHTALADAHQGEDEDALTDVGFTCATPDNQNSTHVAQDGPFVWNELTQGYVLAGYFWGYIFTQYPGGRAAETLSAKWVLWTSVFVNAVFTLLTPLAAKYHYGLVITVRVIEGLGAGVSLPALHVLLSKWAPPKEKNRISSFVYAGMTLGTVISLPFSGVLASTVSWESVFYIQGALSLVWCLSWPFLVFDSPLNHPFISHEEKGMLVRELKLDKNENEESQSLSFPWRSVLTSVPFWAILVAHVCNNWGWYMLLVELPTYMKQVLRFEINENAFLSALPYLVSWIFSFILSTVMDKLKQKELLSVVQIRKISTGIASVLPAICLLGVAFAGCSRIAAVTLMVLAVMFISGMYIGFLTNHVDIAPNFSGTLIALTNTCATIPGFIVPAFVGALTHGNQSVWRWQLIFAITAGIYVMEFIFYTIFASGDVQTWNQPKSGKSAQEAARLTIDTKI